jgi:hypothetical protein
MESPKRSKTDLLDSARFEIDSGTRPPVCMILDICKFNSQIRGTGGKSRKKSRSGSLSKRLFRAKADTNTAAGACMVASRRWSTTLIILHSLTQPVIMPPVAGANQEGSSRSIAVGAQPGASA